MAPIQTPRDQELDPGRCFNGEQQLISWEAVYAALSDPDTASKSAPLQTFLRDDANLEILSRPWKPFPEPSPQEKAKFESKTAPISVTPGAAAHYNIDEIKTDSLWLSQTARISELAALRLVILEWQSRPTAQLLTGFTEEEALSVNDAAGLAALGSSTFNSSIVTAHSTLAPGQFDSEDQRRLRILDQYFSARATILRISQLLVSWGAATKLRVADGNEYKIGDEWLEKLGQDVASRQSPKAHEAVNQSIRAVEERWNILDNGFAWDIPESIRDQAAEKWVAAHVTELIHILHLALLHADLYTEKYLPTATIELWFTSVADKFFFANLSLPPQLADLGTLLHLLTSLFSLSVLKVNAVLEDVQTGRYTSWDPSTYVLNSNLLETLSNIFGSAKHWGPSPATVPAFAWSVLTWRLTAEASVVEQHRERQIESGSASSLPRTSALEDAVLPLTRLEASDLFERKLPFQDIAEYCSNFGVLQIMTRFVELGMDAFGTKIDRLSRDRFRFLLLHVVRGALSSGIIEYETEVVICAHAIMTGGQTFRSWANGGFLDHADPITKFCLDDSVVLRTYLIDEARTRYPYELVPILKFSSALARGEKSPEDRLPAVAYDLASIQTFMQRLPQTFGAYSSIREEENANWVELIEDLPLFATQHTSVFGGARRLLTNGSGASQVSMFIPHSTQGNIVDDRDRPYVALWQYGHSALDYLIKLLSTLVVGSSSVEYSSEQPVSVSDAAEIIGFLADLLHSSLRGEDKVCSPDLLAALRIGSDHGQDTINIVLAILDQELLRLCNDPGKEDSLDLIVHCMHFLQALVLVTPNRIWPWLARSRLLEGAGNGGSLATILIGTEVVLGRFDLLISSIQLFQLLIEDAVGRAVSRKAASKALTRFNAVATTESGSSDKTISNTLLNFGRTLATVYEGSLSWPFQREADRMDINIGICEAFDAILTYAYGADDTETVSAKLTSLVAPISQYLVDLYLSRSENDFPTNPMLMSLLVGAKTKTDTFAREITSAWQQQTQATLALCNTLIRIATLLSKPWTHLEQQLFKATPLLARLYAASDRHKGAVISLLESLVRGAVREGVDTSSKNKSNEPPSLLGHLGPQTAKNFLGTLSRLDEPLRVADIQIRVWTFLSAVLTCKQQWLAIYLLTGTTPRESAKNKSSASQRHKALLSRALESITNLDFNRPDQDWALHTATLEFISAAQNNWSWAGDLRRYKDFIQKLIAYLKWLAEQPIDEKSLSGIETRSYLNNIAARASEVLAMHIHNSRQRGEDVSIKEIIPALAYLEENAVKLPSYNISLHSKLKTSFEKQFQGISIAKFKRTSLRPGTFGIDFFYDIKLADKLLHFANSWSGPRAPGFSEDVKRANLNLGLVESQVQLLNAWKVLASELSHAAAKDERLTKILIGVVKKCMATNADSSLPEALFGQLTSVRADLAFILLQRLAKAKIGVKESRDVLVSVWTATRAATSDFDTVFSSDAVHYYRSVLRILYLSLQLLSNNSVALQDPETSFRGSFGGSLPKSSKELVEPLSTLLLEILSDTVARGFRSLATQLHAEPSTIHPSDFAILTAILQIILAIPEMATWHAQAALLFSNSNTIRYATSLFSWSDRLTIQTNNIPDPIYGELSLLFILSLSSLQNLAEQMAVEGILSQLNSANLMNYFRRPGGMSPFDSPPRIFNIWSKGILPLCLNLLRAVGAPIAAEISAFLNQFPEQLDRASNSLNARAQPKITLSLASEAHSLALISAILETNRSQGPRLGIQGQDIQVLGWEREIVREDVESWVARRQALRDRVVVLDEGDAVLAGRKAAEGGAGGEVGNLLEERVLREVVAAGECLGWGRGNGNGNGGSGSGSGGGG